MYNQVSWEYMEERVLQAEMAWSKLLYKSNKKLSKYRKEVFKLRKELCKTK